MTAVNSMPILSEKALFPDTLNISSIFADATGTKTKKEVHKARVLVKKLRARLKLVNALLPGEPTIILTDTRLRTFNQTLSHLRDLDVVSATLQEVSQKHSSKALSKIIGEIQGYCRVRIQQEKSQSADLQEQAERIIRGLDGLTGIELRVRDIHTYLKQQRRTCCHSGEKALRTQKCEKLHKWRKQVKSLIYQLEITKAPNKLQDVATTLNKLATHLGQVHDYCFILEFIDSIGRNTHLKYDPTPLLDLLENEKHRQIKKVTKLQQKICLA